MIKKLKWVSVLLTLFAFNAFADGSKVALGGYCAVGFTGAKKAVFGDPQFTSEYKGKLYYLSSEGAKKMFDAEPEKFVSPIQFNGYCVTGLAMGKRIETDPKIFSIVDDKIYFFSSVEAKTMFEKNPKDFIAKADKNWKKLLK